MTSKTTPTPNNTKALIKKSALDKSKNINRTIQIPTNDNDTYLKYFSFKIIPKINNPKASKIQKNVRIPLSKVKNRKHPILRVAG